MKKVLSVLLILAVIVGTAGVILSVFMVVRAVQWQEWGRVLLYVFTAFISLEMVILAALKQRSRENA